MATPVAAADEPEIVAAGAAGGRLAPDRPPRTVLRAAGRRGDRQPRQGHGDGARRGRDGGGRTRPARDRGCHRRRVRRDDPARRGPTVAEVDNSDLSLASVDTDVAVVTNLDHDHPTLGISPARAVDGVGAFVRRARDRVVLGPSPRAAAWPRTPAPVWRYGPTSPRGSSVSGRDPLELAGRGRSARARPASGCSAPGRRQRRTRLRPAVALGAEPGRRGRGLGDVELRPAPGDVGIRDGVRVFDDCGNKHPGLPARGARWPCGGTSPTPGSRRSSSPRPVPRHVGAPLRPRAGPRGPRGGRPAGLSGRPRRRDPFDDGWVDAARWTRHRPRPGGRAGTRHGPGPRRVTWSFSSPCAMPRGRWRARPSRRRPMKILMTNNALDRPGRQRELPRDGARRAAQAGSSSSCSSRAVCGQLADGLRGQGFDVYDDVARCRGTSTSSTDSTRRGRPGPRAVPDARRWCSRRHSWFVSVEDPVRRARRVGVRRVQRSHRARLRAHVGHGRRRDRPPDPAGGGLVRRPRPAADRGRAPRAPSRSPDGMKTMPARLAAACAARDIDFSWVGGGGRESPTRGGRCWPPTSCSPVGRTALEAMAAARAVRRRRRERDRRVGRPASYQALEADGFTGLADGSRGGPSGHGPR